jgi:glycosyltransferase involved in cell wall biosynthesis
MKRRGCNWLHIHTIHCGIDLSRYQILRSSEEIRSLYHIRKNDPVIGVVGNIKEWKGQETVVRAMAIAVKHFPNLKCFLVGGSASSDKVYRQRLEQLCDDLKIESHVIFTGFQANPIEFMNAMDIVIHSSIHPEPFGIVNLEAMSLKKPVISTDIGAPCEIFEHGRSGLLVTPGVPEKLAQSIVDLLSNPEFAIDLGRNAYIRLQNHFTLEKNVRQTTDIYDSLLGFN